MFSTDTQTNPAVPKAVSQKAIDEGAYVVLGPVHSGSMIVSMGETRRAEITNFTGGEAAVITQQGNPYILRTSFTQSTSMPKLGETGDSDLGNAGQEDYRDRDEVEMWIGDKHLNEDLGAAALRVLDVESSRILLAARETITSAQIDEPCRLQAPGIVAERLNSVSAGWVASMQAIKRLRASR